MNKLKPALTIAFILWITLFKFELSSSGQTLEMLYSFQGPDGSNPIAALVQGDDGSFYGSTYNDGEGYGTVFRITTDGVLNTLTSFHNTNGAFPFAALVKGADGKFYGTTYLVGTGLEDASNGTVFQVDASGGLNTIYYFPGSAGTGAFGAYPYPGLTSGADGALYGLTVLGGDYGLGTAFRITTGGLFTHLSSFNGLNGAFPQVAMTLGADGNFYGTTQAGPGYLSGENSYGTVFRMTPDGALANLFTFNNDANGGLPNGVLARSGSSDLYGITTGDSFNTLGTIFRITTNGTLTTLVSFLGSNGSVPQAGLMHAQNGNFYGTTTSGGQYGYGTVFRMTPEGILTTLLSFNGTNGNLPRGALVEGIDGNLYGTTQLGGFSHLGNVIRIVMPRLPESALFPNSASSGATADLRLTISGSGFAQDSLVLWNDQAFGATVRSEREIEVIIPAAFLSTTGDFETVEVRVRGPGFEVSNSALFTIIGGQKNVDGLRSGLANQSQPAIVSLPSDSGGFDVEGTLSVAGNNTATLTLARYNGNPAAGVPFDVAGEFVDIHVSGATASDTLDSFLYYPASLAGPPATLTFYNQTTAQWEEVSPIDNQAFQHRFAVHFDARSHPKITELGGTIFVAALPDRTPPTVICPNVFVPCNENPLVAVTYPAPTTLRDNIDPPSAITLSYSIPSGSGFRVGKTSVTVTATDKSGNATTTAFVVTRAPLDFTGFLPPISGADSTGGSFDSPVRTFGKESTIPVKFRLSCGGTPVRSGIHKLMAAKFTDSTHGQASFYVSSDDEDRKARSQFTFEEGVWKLELDIEKAGLSRGIWRLTAVLSDASTHECWIKIK